MSGGNARGTIGLAGRVVDVSAAAVLVAALTAAGCAERAEDTALLSSEVGALESRWLIPPDPELDPPLAAPLAIAVDEERGRLLLLEAQPPALRVYGLGGRFRTTLGGEGGGPGEYRHPIDMAVGPEGIAAVLSMSGRVTYWGADDELLGTVAAGGAGLATRVLAARADSFYVKIDRFPPDDVAEFRVSTPEAVLPGARYSDAAVPGTESPGSSTRNHSYAVASTPGGEFLLSPPGPDYMILRVGPDGELRETIRRPELGPLHRSAEEIETIEARIRERFSELGARAPQDLRVPTLRSHIARLAVAPDSTIWALTRRGAEGVSIIDAFEKDGSYTATYLLDLRVSDLAVGAERLYLVAISDLDVPGVAVVARPDFARERGGSR